MLGWELKDLPSGRSQGRDLPRVVLWDGRERPRGYGVGVVGVPRTVRVGGGVAEAAAGVSASPRVRAASASACGSVPGVVAVGEVCGVSPRGAARSWTAAKQDFGWVRHTAVDAMGVEVKDCDPLGFLSPRFVKSLCCFGNEIIVFTFAIFVTSLMVYHISTNFSTLALYHVLLACKRPFVFLFLLLLDP